MKKILLIIFCVPILITGCAGDTYTPSDPSERVEQYTISKYSEESTETETKQIEETKVYSLGDISLADIPSGDWNTNKEETTVESTESVTSYTSEFNQVYTPSETYTTSYYLPEESLNRKDKDPYEVDSFVLTKSNNSYCYTTKSSSLLDDYVDSSTGIVFGEQGNNNTQPNWIIPINENIDKYNGYVHKIVGNWYKTKYPQNEGNRYDVGQPILIAAINTDISSDGYTIKGSYFLVYKDNPLIKVSIKLNTQQNGDLVVTVEE